MSSKNPISVCKWKIAPFPLQSILGTVCTAATAAAAAATLSNTLRLDTMPWKIDAFYEPTPHSNAYFYQVPDATDSIAAAPDNHLKAGNLIQNLVKPSELLGLHF